MELVFLQIIGDEMSETDYQRQTEREREKEA